MNKVLRTAIVAGAVFAVPAAVNLVIASQRREVLNALPGDSGEYTWPLGNIAYQVRGEGEPLLLVHGVGAGESSYEWRHNFDALSEHFRVYALDLPGFGRSSRKDINYTADLYVLALMDFLRDVVQAPAHVIASSLSGAFVAKLALSHPEMIERLILVCPTGLEKLRSRPPVWSQVSYGALSLPAIGASLYNGLVSRGYMDSYMRQNLYLDPTHVTPALVDHYYQSAHQAGAQYAIRSFISGLLNCDLTNIYPELQQSILIVWGRYARMTPVENANAFLEQNANARLRIFEDSSILPHDEEAGDFNLAVTRFLTEKELPPITRPAFLREAPPALTE